MYLNGKVWNKNRRAKFLCRTGGKIFVVPMKGSGSKCQEWEKKKEEKYDRGFWRDEENLVPRPPPSPCQPQAFREVTSIASGSGFFGGRWRGAEFHLWSHRGKWEHSLRNRDRGIIGEGTVIPKNSQRLWEGFDVGFQELSLIPQGSGSPSWQVD